MKIKPFEDPCIHIVFVKGMHKLGILIFQDFFTVYSHLIARLTTSLTWNPPDTDF